ncbi:hypothetical protein AAFF_G00421550 [Aldrovandia affinis]|uniref:Uncharacterized protein n=1 Tax=Aldrovandia affinis TaxID=143900 RepID=A0AAD7S9S1_9TELE|nr:hypothetical protein AAFF_G00421550 [Aldrovandia affinis]
MEPRLRGRQRASRRRGPGLPAAEISRHEPSEPRQRRLECTPRWDATRRPVRVSCFKVPGSAFSCPAALKGPVRLHRPQRVLVRKAGQSCVPTTRGQCPGGPLRSTATAIPSLSASEALVSPTRSHSSSG